MLNPAIGKLIRNSESRYKLVLEVAKKARAIAQQAEENKDIVVEKPETIAIMCVVLVFAQISVLAAFFKDVNATKYSWATDAINEMSQNLEQE